MTGRGRAWLLIGEMSMSDEHGELKTTADSEPFDENIDLLKVEEKEKLSAAEAAYTRKETTSANGSAAQPTNPQPASDDDKKKAWLPGVILIGLGVVFLVNNVTDFRIDNWWALFIMIPAIGSFSKAWDGMRAAGEMTRDVWGAIAGGMILTLVASAFLFNLDWGLIWPAFLIIGGLGILLGARKAW